MPTINTFQQWLRRQVSNFRGQYPPIQSDRHAFASWALAYINTIDEDEAFDLTDTLSRGDGGLDGYYFDQEDDEFILLQSKYPDDFSDRTSGLSCTRELLSAYQMLLSPETAMARSTKLGEIALRLRDAVQGGAKVTLQCVVAGDLTEEARAEFVGRCAELLHCPSPDIWTLDRLYEEFVTREEADDLSGQDIIFDLFHTEVIHVPALPGTSGISGAVIANFSAKSFASRVAALKPRIFAGNVRYHLGKATRVNKGIRSSLSNEDGRNSFFFYNNGLTLVCDAATIIDNPRSIRITNPQIVNGCQTAMALCDHRLNLESHDIPLAVRVVTIDASEAGRTQLVRIAENTNSQSPVLTSDLKSNDRVQSAIQANFKSLGTPWFYERKRKEWQTLTRSQKAPFESRRLSMVDVGQRWRAFAGQPSQAIVQKEEVFTDSSIYGEVFKRDRDVREYLFAFRLFDDFDSLLTESKRQLREDVAGPEFDGDYLNRVLRARKLWVAHMVALVARLIERVYGSRHIRVVVELLALLESDPTQLDTIRVWSIGVFKQWCRSLPSDSDLKRELKSPNAESALGNILEDQIRMSGGLIRVQELLPTLSQNADVSA